MGLIRKAVEKPFCSARNFFRKTALILSSLAVIGCAGDGRTEFSTPDANTPVLVGEAEQEPVLAVVPFKNFPVYFTPKCTGDGEWKSTGKIEILLGDYIDRVLNNRWTFPKKEDKTSSYFFSTSLSDSENANPFSNGKTVLEELFTTEIHRLRTELNPITIDGYYGKKNYVQMEDFWAGGFHVYTHAEIDTLAYTLRFYGENGVLGVPILDLYELEFRFHNRKWRVVGYEPHFEIPEKPEISIFDGGSIRIVDEEGNELLLKNGHKFELDTKWRTVLGWTYTNLFELILVRDDIQYLENSKRFLGFAGNPNWELCYDGVEGPVKHKLKFELVHEAGEIFGEDYSCILNPPYVRVTAEQGLFSSDSPRKVSGKTAVIGIGPEEGQATECDMNGPMDSKGRMFIQGENGVFDFTVIWWEPGVEGVFAKIAYGAGEAEIVSHAYDDGRVKLDYIEYAGGDEAARDTVLVVYDPSINGLRSLELVYNDSGVDYVTFIAAGPFLGFYPFNRGEGERTERGTVIIRKDADLLELGILDSPAHGVLHLMERD